MIEDKVDVRIDNIAGGHPRVLPPAEVFGVTYPTACRKEVINIIEGIKEYYPKSIIMVGGPHPTVLPESTAKELKSDYVIRGEAELWLHKNVLSLTKQKNPRIIDAGIVPTLNSLPFPSRNLLNRETVINLTGIHGSKRPSTSMISARGCPYRCRYCVSAHKMYTRYRFRSAGNVVSEMRELQDVYGIEHVRFSDDCFTLNKKRTLKLAARMEDVDMTFICMTRADAIDRETALALKEAGCIQVQLGIEYASPRMLKLMNKQMAVEDYRRAIKLLRNAGIAVKALLMMGYPGETTEDRELTLRFLEETKPQFYNLSKFVPLPGSGFEWHGEDTFFYPDDDEGWLEYKKKIEKAIEE